jgi:peptidoglycan hydrolase CwlO-like protein
MNDLPKQIVTQTPVSWPMTYDPQNAIDNIMGAINLLQTENAELQAKIEGYEKYIKILEGQIKIAENIILNNNK